MKTSILEQFEKKNTLLSRKFADVCRNAVETLQCWPEKCDFLPYLRCNTRRRWSKHGYIIKK